ncbi:unnamed protein product [Sphenostylis stenocarpa]|uniref:Uncharacterized protein n=1 Tax=Sphenostylis stenocarpa TaxID=92480 RepID=A0AA86T3Y0_9FABA|nr:unnamed protein product [Sphenostylis stenocarpa]
MTHGKALVKEGRHVSENWNNGRRNLLKKMVVSLGSGPWDQLFGGGNAPAFGVAAVAALVSGFIAVLAIPRSGGQKSRSQILHIEWDNKLGTLSSIPRLDSLAKLSVQQRAVLTNV